MQHDEEIQSFKQQSDWISKNFLTGKVDSRYQDTHFKRYRGEEKMGSTKYKWNIVAAAVQKTEMGWGPVNQLNPSSYFVTAFYWTSFERSVKLAEGF